MEASNYSHYQKKITPYLDGSLREEEKVEFEAFIETHPEFRAQIKIRQNEIELIQRMLPQVSMPLDVAESLEEEIKISVYNLLREEPETVWDFIRTKFEDLTSR